MKFGSILNDKVSGSVGSIVGAMGSGGKHFRTKIKPHKHTNIKQEGLNQSMREANIAWQGMTTEARETWEVYGKSLIHTNATGHLVKQTGWTAFNGAYILLRQANKSIDPLLNQAPLNKGYLEAPEGVFTALATRYRFTFTSLERMQFSTYISPKFKNTINTNRFSYYWYRNNNIVAGQRFGLPFEVQDGRFFIKLKRIEPDGSMSLENVYKEDFALL